MISYAEALKTIHQVAIPLCLEREEVALFEALGRVLAEDIFSTENIPAADNSAMDGFAVRSQETQRASDSDPLRLAVRSVLAAGDGVINKKYPDGSCVEIMTGALMPEERFDAVVKVEDVLRQGNEIFLTAPVPKGDNVRPWGTDFSMGQKVLSKNTVLQEQHVMALAALGISRLLVQKKIRVAVLSTGNEIVPFERENLKGSQVRNSSAPFLKMFLERNHCRVELFGILSDEPENFLQTMRELLAQKFDLILTTGAVSMGKWDFIAPSLPDLKMEILFHKVAIRPGKPILLAVSENRKTVFFGLPGNPISTAVGARFFVKPLIENILGITPAEKWASLKEDVTKPQGLECFFKAQLQSGKSPVVQSLKGQASYMIHSFVQSNAWIQLPAQDTLIKAGTEVRIFEI